MSNLFDFEKNDSFRQEDDDLNSFTNSSSTLSQHQQISRTIFWCLNNHTTSDDDDMNIEIIDISDDDDEEDDEDENTCKNGTSIDDSSDEEEIEVIQLSDDDDDEVNKTKDWTLMDNHEINELSMNVYDNEMPLDLTYKTLQSINMDQQPTDPSSSSSSSSSPSTSQTVHQPLICSEEDEDNTNDAVVHDRVTSTLGLHCPECSLLIDSRPKLVQHLKIVHKKLPFKCMIRGCNRQFSKRSLLNKHLANHKRNKAKFICSAVDCQFETTIQQSFTVHVYQYHEKGLFQCSRCTMQFDYRSKLKSHYASKHEYPQNRAAKRFQCTFVGCAGYVGRDRFDLEAHQIVKHTKLRPYRCTWPDCGHAANCRSNLIGHIRTRHLHIPATKKEATEKNVHCDQDARQFVRKIPYDLPEALKNSLIK